MITPEMIRAALPYEEYRETFISSWGDRPTDSELSIGDVVLTNGLFGALWCLRLVTPQERVSALLPTVKRASAFAQDSRVHDCIAALETFVETGDAEGLRTAADDARTAAYVAAEAANAADANDDCVDHAACKAAHAAAYAAEAAYGDDAWASWGAGRASAEAASWAASGDASLNVEKELQKADLLAAFPPLVFSGWR
jgi:hypothetical protein